MGRQASLRSVALAVTATLGLVAGLTVPAWAATPYTARQSTTYWSLSRLFGVSITALEGANPTHPWWDLYPGLRLIIPSRGSAGTSAAGTGKHTPGTTGRTTSGKGGSGSGGPAGGASGGSGSAGTSGSGAVGGISQASLDLIAQMAVAEEGNRSYQDQLGVAAVIINRLKNGGFGSTIHAILFAPGQFTPISNGYFYQVAPTATSFQAAAAAASGQDPTGGALYFYDPGQGVTSSWIYTRTVTTIIDGTVYAL